MSTESQELVRYNVVLPNKARLVLLIALGWTLLVIGVVFAVWLFFAMSSALNNPFSGPIEYYDGPSLQLWVLPPVLVVAAIVMLVMSIPKFTRFYRRVQQGQVVVRDSEGGAQFIPVSWYVIIEGYTLSNEIRYSKYHLTAGKWQDTKDGDILDFRA